LGVDHRARSGGEAAGGDPWRPQPLAPDLRALASRAAAQVDGVALIFVVFEEGETPQLRAAAGFPTAEMARTAAAALAPSIASAVAEGVVRQAPCPARLPERLRAGLDVHPLRFGERTRGVLVVGPSGAPDAAQRERIAQLVELTALRLDHARVSGALERAEARLRENGEDSEGRSEEILKLSEALFAQDIELLRKEEKLGKIEKLKNDFIEKMSRELRTPLNKIIEAVISVLTGENETLSEDAKTALRCALDDGSAFQRTLQNILDLWKIKQGELPVEIQDVNFRELVNEAIFSIQDRLDGRRLVVEPKLQEPFPKLRTDVTKLNQILFLLLENAVRFTPEGRVEILAHVRGDRLVCEVRDTGIGICPDDQQLIFDEFFQVDDSPASSHGGSGLGLALVRDLVVLLDGEIGVSSDVGRGTSMTFQIPIQLTG
jgi:signal transduction histidine kinase